MKFSCEHSEQFCYKVISLMTICQFFDGIIDRAPQTGLQNRFVIPSQSGTYLRNHKKYRRQLSSVLFLYFYHQKVGSFKMLISVVALRNSTPQIALPKTRAKPIQIQPDAYCFCSFWNKKVMREFLSKKDMRKFCK